ncbi:MAG: hypothetical protein KAG92_02775 [Deltaproteobacteria bacterium]|nr:hypothetical protein [Deltaproteobacteria bacterium]
MDQKQMMKQMLEMNKLAYDSTFQNIIALQEQTQSMTNNLIAQATWLPEEGKKAIDEWVATYKKGREDFKKLVDDAFENVLNNL